MPVLRKIRPQIDNPCCEECSDRAELVMEDYPGWHQHRTLCRDCAIIALRSHPDILASVVINLILAGERGAVAIR